MKTLIKLFTILLITNSINAYAYNQLSAQPDTSDKAFSEYAYIQGTWSVSMKVRSKSGEFVSLPNKSKLVGFYHQDGRTVQTIFTNSKGFFSTDLRAYDVKTKSWRAHFLNAQSQRWHGFESKMDNGRMITQVKNGFSGKEQFDVRIIHQNFQKDRFEGEVFHSIDDGKSWRKVYEMAFSRVN